jgi:hypothetical protein
LPPGVVHIQEKEPFLSDVIVKLAEGKSTENQDEVLPLLDQEIERFSTYMSNLPDARAAGPLINPEKAILKTYLVAKLRGRL